jgi:lysine 2,3-aminomutase
MEQWQKTLAASVTRAAELADRYPRYPVDTRALEAVTEQFPMRITPHYLGLIKEPGDPIWRQCVPDPLELKNDDLPTDPLNEKGFSPVAGLIHRYPDRAVWLVSAMCATLCRFCMRKHCIGRGELTDRVPGDEALDYLHRTPAIRDVILSGGDPFLLPDGVLQHVLSRLRKIPHVEIIRINTRAPVTLPERVTPGLCRLLKKYHPLYVNTHFNHPSEITSQAAEACSMLADAGIPLGNQTVLLRGVNDEPIVMKNLLQKLLTIRVRPYYIHQMDRVKGTRHFHVGVSRGLEIISGLRGHTTGLAVPYFVIDLPGGRGKVPLLPDDVQRRGDTLLVRNYQGEVVEYPDTKDQCSMTNDQLTLQTAK